MQFLAGSANYPKDTPPPVVTIGNFDGLHMGHRSLLDLVLARARELGAPSCAFTFEPPPRSVLSPKQGPPRITPWMERIRSLTSYGIDHVVLENFSAAFAQHPPEWFVSEIIIRRLRARSLIVGYDFRFGKARAGDVHLLRRLAPELDIEQVPPLKHDGQIVSSSLIRQLVQEGDVGKAANLLGRPHQIHGVVVPGLQRGRKIGFPTANLTVDTELLPGSGVYAVFVCIDKGERLLGVANLGIQPTFAGHVFQTEIHLLDFSGDVYGCELDVQFVERLRPERKFSSSEALVHQLSMDVRHARELLDGLDRS